MTHHRALTLTESLGLMATLLLIWSGCRAGEGATGPRVQANGALNADGTGEGWERYPCGCLEDVFIQIGQRVPGFGGFWLDPSGNAVIVAVTDLSLTDTAVAETRVFFNEDRQQRLGLSGEIHVVQVEYPFADLAQWSSDLTPILWWKGVNGLGVTAPVNRIHVEVSDVEELRPRVEAWAAQHGIPVHALQVDWGEFVAY